MPSRCLCMILSATALALLSSGAILAEDSNKSQAYATIRPSLTGGPYSVAAINDPPIEQWLHQILDEPVPRLDFPGATPLSEILDAITTHFNEKHNVKPRTKTGNDWHWVNSSCPNIACRMTLLDKTFLVPNPC